MRIAIVNDLAIAIEALRRVLAQVPDHEIAWVAEDGAEAVEKCAGDVPDLVLMDLIMPVMDGVEATRQIMKQSPCAILVVTASVGANVAIVFEAMGCGALDAVNTPAIGAAGALQGGDALLTKVEIIGRLIGRPVSVQGRIEHLREAVESTALAPPVLAIGASAGGPKAVAQLLARLPRELPAAVVIVQHVDTQFAAGLAGWLSDQAQLRVDVAQEGRRLRVGEVVIAGSSDHLVVTPGLRLKYSYEPQESSYRPSIDVFFQTMANNWPQDRAAKSAAVLLTGMGRDGAEGLLRLHEKGWYTVAEHEDSCVVYGMPRAAIELGAVTDVLPLPRIAPAITEHFQKVES